MGTLTLTLTLTLPLPLPLTLTPTPNPDQVDARIAARILGELKFLDGEAYTGLMSLTKRHRQLLAATTPYSPPLTPPSSFSRCPYISLDAPLGVLTSP